MMISNGLTIVSGGQSGADRAALDFALEHRIPIQGWCPKGRMAEDGPIPERYLLIETDTDDPAQRTRLNTRNSEGTFIIYMARIDEGTDYTLRYAKSIRKPVFILNGNSEPNKIEFKSWLKNARIKRLNIAGPRESNDPGIYEFTLKSLDFLFSE